MGSIYDASCDCGFEKDVKVGGGRESFHKNSVFPFYCATCGMVSVNVAKLKPECTSTDCPKCGTPDAVQYGVSPVSKKTGSVALKWGNRQAKASGNLCPSCKKMTLKFSSSPSVLFD